jgi:hypothetical protein
MLTYLSSPVATRCTSITAHQPDACLTMTRANPGARKSGTLYIEARRLPGVNDGYGVDSVEAQVQAHLRRTYQEVNIGQKVPLSERIMTLLGPWC